MTHFNLPPTNLTARKNWESFLTILPMYTPLRGDLLASAALDLSIGPKPLISRLSEQNILGVHTLSQQEALMTTADKLWHRWKSDPNVKAALTQYAEVCLHQSGDLLDDSALHYKVRGFGLLKYYFCAVQMGVFDDKSELWESHCKLTRYRIWGEHLNFSYFKMEFKYNLAGTRLL
ncbi:hypothetical protein AB4348_18485 [Vibrio breoganii]